LKKGEGRLRLIPQIQNNNHRDYEAVLAEAGIIRDVDVPSYAGNRKIFRAYRYFQNRIDAMANGGDTPLDAIMQFLDKIGQACLVKIEVASHADAYTLFESLNNRGMPLSAVDLIKNKLLAGLEMIEPGKIDDYFAQWNTLLNCLGDDYTIQERFFRQYYNAFKDDLKAIHQVPVATRSNMIHIYEKLIDHDAKDCLDKIRAAGRMYAVILSRNPDDTLKELEKPLKDLERIQGAPSYLLELAANHLATVTELFVRFFVRRNLTDMPPTRDLTRLFMAIIDKSADLKGEAVLQIIAGQLVEISASDDVFKEKLEGPIYDENAGVSRFILCALAEKAMTKETWIDLWRIENKKFLWTIEHIFPQGKNIPQSWIDMIGDGDEQTAIEIQRTHVHKLGNLTISGFNSALGNKSFVEKRDRVDRQGRAMGYKNGLKLNEDLAEAEHWGKDQIDQRTSRLVDSVMALFKLQGDVL